MPPRVNTGGVWISGVDAGAAVFAAPRPGVADEPEGAVDVVDDGAVHAFTASWSMSCSPMCSV
jgi:hypothetical protein